MTRNLKEFVNQNEARSTAVANPPPDHVTVLLALRDGGAFLSDQLESIAAQTHRAWSLVVSDDGSRDRGPEIAMRFALRFPQGRVRLRPGPRRGAAQNFLALARLAGPLSPYAAFADQDDVWIREKLEIALQWLQTVPDGIPALYCGRTIVCDGDLTARRNSPLFRRAPGFANALVQNVGGGNTMVLNRAALDLLQDTASRAEGIVAHDWWTYQLVTGAGGQVFYDPRPMLLYRQHGGNHVGANDTFPARAQRLRALLAGRYRDWNAANAAALDRVRPWLTPEARETLDAFDRARTGRLAARLAAVRAAGLYRQTIPGTLALWLAALLRRL